jgi:hypothetical protein
LGAPQQAGKAPQPIAADFGPRAAGPVWAGTGGLGGLRTAGQQRPGLAGAVAGASPVLERGYLVLLPDHW